MYNKIISLEFLKNSLNIGRNILSLDEIINHLQDSHKFFNLICQRLSKKEKKQLDIFIKNIDSLFLNNFIQKAQEELKTESKELSKNLVCLLNQTKNLYLINTIIALRYLETLQQLKNNQEQLTLAYVSNKIDFDQLMFNKIIEKDVYQIKEFDGIFVSEQTGTLIEVKHTLSKYAFKQIFGYTIKKKNKNKHSHLDIILDKQLCQDNKIPDIKNLIIVFKCVDSSFGKKENLGLMLKSLKNNSMIKISKSKFVQYLYEFVGQQETRIKIQQDLSQSDIKNIFFYKVDYPDFKSIFLENNHILSQTLTENLPNFIERQSLKHNR